MTISLQVKVEVKNLAELSKLVKYCKLNLLQHELDIAFKKADEFGKNIVFIKNYLPSTYQARRPDQCPAPEL